MQTIKTGFLLSVVMFTAGCVWLAADLLRAMLEVVIPAAARFATDSLALALLCMRGLGVLAFIGGGCALLWWMRRSGRQGRYQRDGAWPVEYRPLVVGPKRLWLWLCGRPVPLARIDPNGYIGHTLILADTVFEVAPAAGWDKQLAYAQELERTRRVQALAPGDETRSLPWFGGDTRAGVANSATGRLLAGAYDKPARLPAPADLPPVPQLPPPAPADLPLDYALERTETQAWPLGYDAEGDLAWFNPLLDAHAAVVGATGTGKTTGVGYLLACHALRQGWHVVIFDADDGASWSPFATQAECCPTSTDLFEAQIAAVHTEFARRQALLAEARAFDINGLDSERRILVVIEEYGDLSRTLRLRDRSAADRVESQLDTLMRRGRKAGVHLVLLDQYPEYWSNQLIANAKTRIVFQLGPNQGAKLEEYKAAQLPSRGAFLLRGRQYTSWHVAPHLRTLLADVPALSAAAHIIRPPTPANTGEHGVSRGVSAGAFPAVSPEVSHPLAAPGNTANTGDALGKWASFIRAYMQCPQGAGLWNEPPTGVRQLARAMSLAETGSNANEASFVGIASKVAQRIRSERAASGSQLAAPTPDRIDLSTEAGRATFAAMATDARLPNGARLGTDITGGA